MGSAKTKQETQKQEESRAYLKAFGKGQIDPRGMHVPAHKQNNDQNNGQQ